MIVCWLDVACRGLCGSGNQIGAEHTLNGSNPVLELQLPLFHSPQHQVVAGRVSLQTRNGCVKVVVFDPQIGQKRLKVMRMIR